MVRIELNTVFENFQDDPEKKEITIDGISITYYEWEACKFSIGSGILADKTENGKIKLFLSEEAKNKLNELRAHRN